MRERNAVIVNRRMGINNRRIKMKKNNLPRGLRNNNPGNIRINDDLFQGEIRPSKDKSFKQFTTMAYGYRAMFKILSN